MGQVPVVFEGGVFDRIVIRYGVVNWKWKIGLFFVLFVVLVCSTIVWGVNRKGLEKFEGAIERAQAAGMDLNREIAEFSEIPAEENFFRTPLFEPLWGGTASTGVDLDVNFKVQNREDLKRLERLKVRRFLAEAEYELMRDEPRGYSSGQNLDFELWAAYLKREYAEVSPNLAPARLTFEFLEDRYKEDFEELGRVALRKNAMPEILEVTNSPIQGHTHSGAYSEMSHLCELLSFRIAVALEIGETQTALESVRIVAAIIEGADSTDSVIGAMVAVRAINKMIESLWFGFSKQQWSKGELEELSEVFSRISVQDLVTESYEDYFRGRSEFWRALSKNRNLVESLFGYIPGEMQLFITCSKWAPDGLIYENGEIDLDWIYREGWEPWKSGNLRVLPSWESRMPDPMNLRATLAVRRLYPHELYTRPQGRALVMKRQVELVCFLELFELQHGRYPESLSELFEDSESTPMDPFSGLPMIYRTEADRYLIYSIGWNLFDDGGKAEISQSGWRNWSKGDWTWNYNIVPLEENLRRDKTLKRLEWERELGGELTESEFDSFWSAYISEKKVKPGSQAEKELQREKLIQSVNARLLKKSELESPSPEEIRRQEIIRAQKEKIRRQREGE